MIPLIKTNFNIPNKKHQHHFKEAYLYLVGQLSLVLRVDSFSSFQ